MKTTILSFLFLLLISADSFSQNYMFRKYRFECSEIYDITLKKPKGFKMIDGVRFFRVNEKKSVGMAYSIVWESHRKDCLILFPFFISHDEDNRSNKIMVYSELKAALNLDDNDKTLEMDTAKYVQTFAGENMEAYFNADTVYVYRIPIQIPYEKSFNSGIYEERYKYCIGINIFKRGHPCAMMKIFFSEEGKEKEQEYMQLLFNTVHYSDVAPEVDDEKWEKVRKRSRAKFMLYHILYNRGKTHWSHYLW